MPEAFRLVKARRTATAFDGEGAAKAGGRWNSRGIRVVYASATRSLAALETLVHIDGTIPFDWVMLRCEFPDELIELVRMAKLPSDWRSHPAPPELRELGDRWAREGRSAVLAVPSVLVPEETNFLLNPLHPDFAKIKKHRKREPFAFDPRLL